MVNNKKFLLATAVLVLALSTLACGINSIAPTPTYPPTHVPPTLAPLPTAEPTLAPIFNSMDGLAGAWLDPDTTGTISTIIAVGDGYAVESVVNSERGGVNELTETNWSNGVLTWTYCVQDGACVTTKTISLNGDNLDTSWSNDQENSGYTTLVRTSSVPTTNTSDNPNENMIGRWLDPDTTGTVTTIFALDGGLAVDSVINPSRGGNELTTQDWQNGVLTWTYCIPDGNCITSVTVSISGDLLTTTWTDDRGYSGTTIMQRVP
jgi:hypothetical protein